MKKLLLGALLVLSMTSFSQGTPESFTTEDLIGYWEPDEHSTQLVIWKDVNNNFQLVEFSTISGTALTLLSMKLDNGVLIVKSRFDEKNWETECSFTFIDKNTLECIIKGPINATIIYTKVK